MANTVLETINIANNTFKNWLDKTNDAINVLKNQAVTVTTTANGDGVTGNGFVTGVLGATTLTATTLRGGTVNSAANLAISSNVTITSAYMNVVANTIIYANSSVAVASFGGNTTVTNSTFQSTLFNVFSNVYISGSVHTLVGNVSVANTTGGNVAIYVDNTNKRLGVKNAAPSHTLSVNGDAYIGGNLTFANTTANTASLVSGRVAGNSSAIFSVDTFSTSLFRSGEYIINIVDNVAPASFQTSKVLVMHDGTSAYITEYAVLQNNGILGSFSADISASDVRIRCTAAVSNVTVKFLGTMVAI